MHYYQFHIGDYKSHTHHLNVIEDCAFRRLLDHYYLHEIPIKQRNIARQIGMLEYEAEVLSILDEFFISTENGFVNPRADEEIANYHSRVDQASRAGKASAQRRLNGRSTEIQQAFNASSTDVQLTINHEPLTNNHIYSDFEKVLKTKRIPLTDTLIASIQLEADKAKWSIEDALKECCIRGWSTFKADWVVKPDIAHQTVPSKAGRDPTLVKLEEDSKNAVAMPDDVKAKFKMIKGKV